MQKFITFLFFLVVSFSYSQPPEVSEKEYQNEIEDWHQNRVKSLKSENGWLNIVGLFWLKEGENTFGSGKGNAVIFPEGKADEKMGAFILNDSIVSLKVNFGANVQVNNQSYTKGIVFKGKEEKPVIMTHKSLQWFIIKRGKRYGVRLRDIESDALKSFTHIDRFPVQNAWRIIATYETPVVPKTIPIHDVIGLTTETPFGGTLYFEIEGKKFKLDATLEGEDLFIVFADETNGNETYGGGRFLYAKKPISGDAVVLDFNKAYNPPCCFTNYATCPLPSAQNKLSVKVTAGEKSYGKH